MKKINIISLNDNIMVRFLVFIEVDQINFVPIFRYFKNKEEYPEFWCVNN